MVMRATGRASFVVVGVEKESQLPYIVPQLRIGFI